MNRSTILFGPGTRKECFVESDDMQYLYARQLSRFNQGAKGRKCLFDYCDLNTSSGALNSLQNLDKICHHQASV